MAKIFSDSIGKIIRLLSDDVQEKQYGYPSVYNSTLEFDALTNQGIIDGLKDEWNNYTLIGGILYHNDILVIINPPGEEYLALQAVKTEYPTLSDWVKNGTALQAETYINAQVWNGQTITQVNTWIDTNITNITTANVSQINIRLAGIRSGLKLVAGAIISMRDLFVLTAKLLIYIRDLVIRFRQ